MNRQERRKAEAIKRKPSKAGSRPRISGKPAKSVTLKSGRGRMNVK